MLLTHTKLVLGNNITYMSAYNYFSAVPMVLLMELKIINDADKYLDKYIEMVRENDADGILYTDSIFNNPKSMIVFGEYLWLMFIREYRKMNDYQKSYCFWRYLEYTKDNITKEYHKYVMPDCAVNTEICAAQLGNKAGLFGAAKWALIQESRI